MADTSSSTTIDFTKVNSLISDWNSAGDQFKGSYKKADDETQAQLNELENSLDNWYTNNINSSNELQFQLDQIQTQSIN